jgi:serine/threonine protein kinase
MQSMLRTATMTLGSIGRHPHIPALWDAFSDHGRSFFVFEPVDGESLAARIRRTGKIIPEQEVIECCLQMAEILDLLSQQSPPLIHGLIRPEHIIISRSSQQYVLTNFSIVLAGGATQFISGMERTRLSPYTAPEFVRGIVDSRSDLFSLMASTYHAVTGTPPAAVGGTIAPASRQNPNISSRFDTILTKGLRPVAGQRYQRPSELRQDLLAMRSVSGSLASREQAFGSTFPRVPDNRQFAEQTAASRLSDSIAQTFQTFAPAEYEEERKTLLPLPEELPPMQEANDKLQAALWIAAVLVALLILVYIGRGTI